MEIKIKMKMEMEMEIKMKMEMEMEMEMEIINIIKYWELQKMQHKKILKKHIGS